MKCPICNEHELVAQSLEDSYGKEPDIFCPKVIKLPSGKILNHYRENRHDGKIRILRMMVLPYRVITRNGKSHVSYLSKYKSGQAYFKTIMKVPEIHPDLEDKLINRIKLLILMS